MSTPAATPMLPNLAEPGTPRLVSLIVPCRNERGHIDAFCDAALAQQLPEGWTLELLVADGASDDGTRAALDARAAADARIAVLDNPRRIVSTGLNACLARARGEVVVRMDVHTVFAPDYVAECLAALSKALKQLGFRFVGPTTVYSTLQSLGVVNDHLAGCWVREECQAEQDEALTRLSDSSG